MSISQHELHVLESIGDQLTASDPELAGLMAIFARLTASEMMPASEHIRVSWRWAARISRRIKRHRRRHRARKPRGRRHLAKQTRTMLIIWLLITASLISAAVALGGGSGKSSCAMARAIGCSQSAAAHSPRPGTS
jgi:hypothetical protein